MHAQSAGHIGASMREQPLTTKQRMVPLWLDPDPAVVMSMPMNVARCRRVTSQLLGGFPCAVRIGR